MRRMFALLLPLALFAPWRLGAFAHLLKGLTPLWAQEWEVTVSYTLKVRHLMKREVFWAAPMLLTMVEPITQILIFTRPLDQIVLGQQSQFQSKNYER